MEVLLARESSTGVRANSGILHTYLMISEGIELLCLNSRLSIYQCQREGCNENPSIRPPFPASIELGSLVRH